MDELVVGQVREHYARAALQVQAVGASDGCCGGGGCCGGAGAAAEVPGDLRGELRGDLLGDAQGDVPGDLRGEADVFGSARYDAAERDALPEAAVLASLGCGNPTAVAELRAGERVLDLGSGGGIDVLLSAQRVGPTGFVYGLDMTPEMLALARANAAAAGAQNVSFLEGRIESVPLPDGAVDVVISNCVVNLSTDKPAVLAEAFRVLVPGGRFGISDVVAQDDVTPAERAERGSHVGCIAGALSRSEYLDALAVAGFVEAQVEFTHEVAPGLHGAIVQALRPL